MEKTIKRFLVKAEEKFGERFDYSDLQYKDSTKQKIKIRCKEHKQIFTILLYHHLVQKYGGCNLCQDSDKSSEIKLQSGEEKKELHWPEFQDLYCVTTFGRVWNKKRGTELTPKSKNHIHLYSNTKQTKCVNIHTLIWECCEGSFDSKKWMIYRKDRNKKNNRLDNLVCVTKSFAVLRSFLLKSIKSQGNVPQEAKSDLLEEKISLGEEANAEEQKTCLDFKSIGIVFGCDFSHYKINSCGVIKNKTGKLVRSRRVILYSKQGKQHVKRCELVAKFFL